MPAAHNRANALEELGFRAGLHRPLALAKPLTVGDAELTCLEFGSPNATLLRKKAENPLLSKTGTNLTTRVANGGFTCPELEF